ncbi:hypothetical protein B0J14DRAFT_563864 [Halenospora varia]|nr:hypothetical protein B0J14DRAFT_563864 [Halenospora varia]
MEGDSGTPSRMREPQVLIPPRRITRLSHQHIRGGRYTTTPPNANQPPRTVEMRASHHFRRNPHELRFLVVHDFRYLQMKNIYYYQMELLHKYPAGMQLENNIADLRKLLADYCQTLRDYEFVLQLPKPSKGKARIQRECLEHELPGANLDRSDHRVIPGATVDVLERIFSQDLSDVAPTSKGFTWTGKFQTLRRDLSGRDIMRRIFVGTFIGAPFLLVPIIILQFRTTIAWRLSTVSIAVVLFSVFLSVCSDQNIGNHLVAVASYAAIMVVFVGTSTNG